MNSKEVKIKRIEPEEVKTPEIKRPDYDYGYKDRPLNTKRSNYNTYLDTFRWGWDNEWQVIIDDYNIKWNLKRTVDSTKIYIPADWTYMINIIWEFSWSANSNWMWAWFTIDWATSYLSQNYLATAVYTDLTTQRIEVVNLLKWQYIEIELSIDWTFTWCSWYIVITKIS